MLTRRMGDSPPVTRLREEVDRLIGRFLGDYEPLHAWDLFGYRRFPTVNVWQDDDNVFVETELPGVAEDDIDLTVVDGELTIKGDRRGLEEKEGATVLRSERGSGAFSRVVHLPVDVKDEQTEAAFHDGVLTVTLPKSEVARSRHIPIKAASA